MSRLIILASLLALALTIPVAAQDRSTFTVGTASAARGQKVTGTIEVPAGVDAALSIPVAVVHGAKPGPVLAIDAGSHGTEYTSIIALEKLIGMFYPLVKRGTYVEQGMKIGYVTDYVGKTIFEARAPVAGVVLYVCAVPSMTKGATIANIGVVAKQ